MPLPLEYNKPNHISYNSYETNSENPHWFNVKTVIARVIKQNVA